MQDQSIRVLLVEDVASDARMISLMLKEIPESPFRLTTVNRLELAIKKISRFKYDIVLLDLGLPDSKGIKTFKSLYSQCSSVPIVIFTVLGSEEIGTEAIGLGAQDYLIKGTSDGRILAKSIKYAIERKYLELRLKQEKDELAQMLDERRRLEDELRFSEQKLMFHVENTPLAVVEFDKNFAVSRWNSEAERVFGWKKEEVLGKKVDAINLVYEVDFTEVKKVMKGLTSGALRTIVVSNRNNTKRGDVIDCMWYNSALLDKNSRMISIMSFVHDITKEKKLERDLKKHINDLDIANMELESFSYSVAHDLKNPLEIMGGFVELLFEECRGKLNEESFDYLKRIKSGKERLSSIIDDMLALSKISRQEITIEDLNLSEMARLSVRELAAANPERRVSVKIQEGLNVRADARLMSVAIGNLLSNAWKFTSKTDNPQIAFGVIHKDEQKIYYVKDNGVGFDMSQAAGLFKPFQRLHSDKEFKGTGVGLAIVDRAISRHGGKVWAEGEPGMGATFYFTLG